MIDDIKAILADISRMPLDEIHDDARLNEDLSITSLDIVLLRESLERRFGVGIDDEEIGELTSVGSIHRLVESKRSATSDRLSPPSETSHDSEPSPPSEPPSEPPPPSGGRATAPTHLIGDALYTDIDVGMHLTGRNGLSEVPLLREVGHIRWEHISALSGVRSRDVVDEDGERLYPTFFFVEISFPQERPLAAFGENDTFTTVSTLRRFGRSMIDGEHYIFGPNSDDRTPRCPSSVREAVSSGIPFVRMSNSFVKQWEGAGWLKKSRPRDAGFLSIPEIVEPPQSYEDFVQAKDGEQLLTVPNGMASLTPEPHTCRYQIDPDRDLNGAGLLYFANYSAILEYAERVALRDHGLEEDLIDRRTLTRRKAIYLSNADATDSISVTTELFVVDPAAPGLDLETTPITLLIRQSMRRNSDDRLMMRSAARKTVTGAVLTDTQLSSPAHAAR